MNDRKYWLILFSGVTWRELMNAGGNVMGFKAHRQKSVERKAAQNLIQRSFDSTTLVRPAKQIRPE